jgi:hypothetical protein
MKVTLLMSPGRRQWLGLEGKLVLEEEKHAARTLERRGASTASKSTSNAGPQHGEEDSTAGESTSNTGPQHGEDSTVRESTSDAGPQHGEEDSTDRESTSDTEEDSTAKKSTSDPELQPGEEDSTARESTSEPGPQHGEEASAATGLTSDPGPQHGEEVSAGNEIPNDSRPPVSEPTRKERTCGRCSDAISFDSTYYKCLGHLCRGALNSELCPTFHPKIVLAITDYYLCEKCEPDLTDVEGHQHKWWHSLLIISKSYLATEDAPKASETTSEVPDVLSKGKTGEAAPPSISSLNEKISGLEEKLDSTRQALEGRLTTTMETLEERVTRLEAKLDTSVEQLKQLLMQVLSNRTNL